MGISYEKLWNTFVHDAETMHVPNTLLDKIHSLRDRYQTVLMTVNMDSFDRFTVPALGLGSYFDLIVNSYTDGRFKNENGGEIFIEYADRLNSSIESAHLIDDSESNCATFRNLGGSAYLVSETSPTIDYLNSLKCSP